MKNLYLVLCLFMGCVEPAGLDTGETSSAVTEAADNPDIFPECRLYGGGMQCCTGTGCITCTNGVCEEDHPIVEESPASVGGEEVPYDPDMFPRCFFYDDGGMGCCDSSFEHCMYCDNGTCTHY